MESIIKELWHGNIIPQEDSRANSKEMKELLGYMARHHEDLDKSFTVEQKEIPVGIFNAKKTNNPRRTESLDSDCGGYFDDTNYKLRGKERARFKEMLEDLLSAVPDTLTVDEVAELTGYHRTTILRYARKKYIFVVNIMGSSTSQSRA